MQQPGLQPRGRGADILIAIGALLALAFGASSCQAPQVHYTGKVDTLSFGDLHLESSALIYIAADRGFLAANGLNVVIKDYDTGPAAIAAVTNHNVDIAYSAEFPFVVRVLAGDNIHGIGTIDEFESFYLVARKDRSVETVADLKGKKIGVTRQGAPEFYLGRFLDLHGMNIRDIAVVDVQPAHWVDAIANSEVDAIVASQAYVSQMRDRLTNGTVVWPVQSSQTAYALLFCGQDWLSGHPDLVKRFLNSLAQAEDYYVQHPAEAKAIVQKRLNLSDAYVAMVWPQHQFSLALDQSLILAMEDEARWMLNNNLAVKKTVPDFLDSIYLEGVQAVRPASVNVVR